MSKYVAVAGKGGAGKTTFTALMLRQIVKSQNNISILAVDADPNANLGEALGLTGYSNYFRNFGRDKKNPDQSRQDDQRYLH